MLKKLSFLALMGVCAAMIAVSSLSATEINQEHSPVGARAESIEKRMAQLETRSELAAHYPEGINDLAKKAKGMKGAGGFSLLNSSASYALHPASYQTANFFYSPEFDTVMVELLDGSIWFVDPYEFNTITHWNSADLVIITENHAWRSPYKFRLTNQRSGQSVAINIQLGPIAPIYACYHTHWITDIDYYNNIVYLEDKSAWHMSMFDAAIVNDWVPGDVVIVCVNDGWLFAFNPNMLFNVAMLNFGVGAAKFHHH